MYMHQAVTVVFCADDVWNGVGCMYHVSHVIVYVYIYIYICPYGYLMISGQVETFPFPPNEPPLGSGSSTLLLRHGELQGTGPGSTQCARLRVTPGPETPGEHPEDTHSYTLLASIMELEFTTGL